VAVFGGLEVLEPDAAELVGQRDEELILVVMLGAEQLQRLVDQLLVRANRLRRRDEVGRAVGDDVQVDVRAQRPAAEMAAGEDGAVDQLLVGHSLVGDAVDCRASSPRGRNRIERGRRGPARGYVTLADTGMLRTK
jgi:hypothetical protein